MNTLLVPLGGSDVFIVDPASCDFSNDKHAVTRFLQEHNLVPKAIVLTHGHFDHVAGLGFLKECYPDIHIYIHKDDASFIGGNSQLRQSEHLYAIGFADFLPSVSNLPEATDYLCDGDELFGEWRVLHTPGHTPGSCVLYSARQNVLISGDTVFFHSWGRTDLPGGSETQIIQSLNRVYREIPLQTKVFPGHDMTGFALAENVD